MRLPTRAGIFSAAVIALLCLQSVANAAFTITLQQSGSNVVATGSGTINTSALSLSANSPSPRVNGTVGLIFIGTGSGQQGTSVAGPGSFGGSLGGAFNVSSSAGDLVGVQAGSHRIIVPAGYVSGAAISSSAEWDNTTLDALSLAEGTYTYTWGSGGTADSLSVVVVAPVPASLSISATHSSPIFQAGPGIITLTVTNGGSSTAADATVSDTIDSAFTINSVSSGCSASGQTVTCTLASGSSAATTAYNVYVTASATAASSISNSATLTDATDTITSGSSSDTIAVTSESPQVDSHLSQIMLSGSTDNGLCADGNMALTATDQLQNTGGSTLTNPYAVIATLSGGNSLLSQSVDSTSLAASGTAAFTFHIQLATCNTFQIFFDVRSN